ncbi:MAG: DUF2141 domain-containing protein [Erythrobacter sp.]
MTGIVIAAGSWAASKASYVGSAVTNNAPAQNPRAPSQIEPAPSASIVESPDRTIQISLSGIRNDKGAVYVALFDDEARYNSLDFSGAVRVQSEPAKPGSQQFTFEELPDGEYAVVVHHDENGNEEFDLSGDYPLEGYGTSGAINAEQVLSFEEASTPTQDIDIAVFYYGQ